MQNSRSFSSVDSVDGIDVMETIDRLPSAALDELPIGAILLNDKAKIVPYNRTEGELTNRDPQQVLGKGFFSSWRFAA